MTNNMKNLHLTTENRHTNSQPIVFYDGECPLCSREIEHYKKVSGAHNMQWVDITRSTELLEKYGLSRETAMARFHVLDGSGNWQTGAWAFIELWSHLRGYRGLSAVVRGLRLTSLLDFFYTRFARWRFRRQQCDTVCHGKGFDE